MASVNQEEIARLAGVSRSTVAWALNPKRRDKLRPETRRKVEEAAAQLNYRPHRYAQIMRAGKSGIIGVLRFPGYSRFRAEAELQLLLQIRRQDYKPVVIASAAAGDDVEAACQDLIDAQVEGVIIEGPNRSETAAVVARFRAARIPMVIVSGTETPGVPHVHSDFRVGMRALGEHLIANGYRRLAILLPWVDPVAYAGDWWRNTDRLLGIADAVAAAGGSLLDPQSRFPALTTLNADLRTFSGESDISAAASFTERSGHPTDPHATGKAAAAAALDADASIDALVCANDDWAIGALSCCAERGIAVPDELAVSGFDNTEVGPYLPVPLTTVSQPVADVVQQAVTLLLAQLNGSPDVAPIHPPTVLIVRRSSAPTRSL